MSSDWYDLLKDGNKIHLKKECDCIIHSGPHWIHMDRLIHQMNHKYLENPSNSNMRACSILELERLREKEWHFKRLGITKIFQK